MTEIQFEWDEAKNYSNQRKHSLSFEEGSQVFLDPLHISVKERVQDGEQRWQTLGMAGGALLLMVAYTLQEQPDVVRIITVRTATARER